MLDAALGGLLRVNRGTGTDANRLADLLTYMLIAILRSVSKYLRLGNLQNSMCHGGKNEQSSSMLDPGRQ